VTGDEWAPGGAANLVYLSFSRGIFAVGCAVFSVVCFARPSSVASTFLGAPLWTPLARLTYGAYLTHPIVIKMLAGTTQSFYRWCASRCTHALDPCALCRGRHATRPRCAADAAAALCRRSYPDLLSRWCLNSMLAYGLAAAAFLLVEKPFMNIEAKLFQKPKPK
jgi:peptidoglycan/LPS O-acetylase OafA/YrhL